MATYTIEVTDAQEKALQYAAVSPSDWAENAVLVRASAATDEIIAKLVTHCNENEIALAVGKDAQVTQAYDLGIVDTAANVQTASQAAIDAAVAE